ncbi:MAG: hypothetical protein II304_02685 [Bacteroidales bacterium]|nr:hypothetical protein [Bacteroidales bacterium]
MIHNGSISIHRKIFLNRFSPVHRKDAFTEFEAWIWMLASAFFFTKETEIFGLNLEIERGSFATTIKHLADTWKWSRNKVYRFLDELEKDRAITLKKSTQLCTQLRSQKCTLVKINNYDDFQPKNFEEKTQSETQFQTSDDTLNNKVLIKRYNNNFFYNSKKNFLNFLSPERKIEEDFDL